MKRYISFIWILIFLGCDARLDEMRPHNMSDASMMKQDVQNLDEFTVEWLI